MPHKPILCLDFDGVVHSYMSPWTKASEVLDPPTFGAIEFMLQALQYFDVVIFSSRSHQEGGTEAMQAWLKKHAGLAWDQGISNVRFVEEKPAATVTIDDRALTFTGVWPAIHQLKAFKPWNRH